MSKVRKIFILFVTIFCAENLFAEYAGNLQIRAGVSLEKMQRQNLKLNSQISGLMEMEEDCDDTNFYLARSSYNIWYLRDGKFGIGFAVDIADITFYTAQSDAQAFTWDIMIGPAFGFRVNDVIKVQAGIGLNVGLFNSQYHGVYSYNRYDIYVSDGDGFGLGVALDLNLEFLPNSGFSPVIGFRFGSIFSDGGHVHYETSSATDNYDADYEIRNYSFRFYAGGAFNFGR